MPRRLPHDRPHPGLAPVGGGRAHLTPPDPHFFRKERRGGSILEIQENHPRNEGGYRGVVAQAEIEGISGAAGADCFLGTCLLPWGEDTGAGTVRAWRGLQAIFDFGVVRAWRGHVLFPLAGRRRRTLPPQVRQHWPAAVRGGPAPRREAQGRRTNTASLVILGTPGEVRSANGPFGRGTTAPAGPHLRMGTSGLEKSLRGAAMLYIPCQNFSHEGAWSWEVRWTIPLHTDVCPPHSVERAGQNCWEGTPSHARFWTRFALRGGERVRTARDDGRSWVDRTTARDGRSWVDRTTARDGRS
eukprot:gene453-biopygen9149